ncbi:F-box/LRR-repeat protein 20 isoform X1 [Rhizophagus clarus]|uniref:F-box/LRR-repeat protein 20 isoform X1 n=1 Tax=Rhizophagus clarus TaxID=94130 RepID=A0A8H3L003_9GLOM|nr:F-box/LRR-repeat protein 20 isoform X1 [Rhizophagus clarus]
MTFRVEKTVVKTFYSDRAFPLLPNEVTLIIFSYLRQQTRLKLCRVSKAFKTLAYTPLLWNETIIYNTNGLELDSTLKRLKNVQALDARATKISDEFAKKLLVSPAKHALKILDLSVTSITNISLISIGFNCTSLEKLFLEGCKEISNITSLANLSSTCNLTTLVLSHYIDGCYKITDDGIDLIATKLIKLKYLVIDGQEINDCSVISVLRNCKELELFAISFSEFLTDIVLEEIILNLQPKFKFLKLRKGTLFSEEGFRNFFEALKRREHSFYSLDFSECTNITNSNLFYFYQPQLKWLSLDWCWGIKDSSLIYLITGCPIIQEIMMTGCNYITCELLFDKIEQLDLTSLITLNFYTCKLIEPELIMKLGKLYPKLYIIDYYGEVYKQGKKFGFKDEVYIKDEICELEVGGREKRWGKLNVGDFKRFYRFYSI